MCPIYARIIPHNYRAERVIKDRSAAYKAALIERGIKRNKITERAAYFENNPTSALIVESRAAFIDIIARRAAAAEMVFNTKEGAPYCDYSNMPRLLIEYAERESRINRIEESAPPMRREYLFIKRRDNIKARLIKKIAHIVDCGTGALKLLFNGYNLRELRAVLYELRAYDRNIPLFYKDSESAHYTKAAAPDQPPRGFIVERSAAKDYFNSRRISGAAQVKRTARRRAAALFLARFIQHQAREYASAQ